MALTDSVIEGESQPTQLLIDVANQFCLGSVTAATQLCIGNMIEMCLSLSSFFDHLGSRYGLVYIVLQRRNSSTTGVIWVTLHLVPALANPHLACRNGSPPVLTDCLIQPKCSPPLCPGGDDEPLPAEEGTALPQDAGGRDGQGGGVL
jgi:hypothetical protein